MNIRYTLLNKYWYQRFLKIRYNPILVWCLAKCTPKIYGWDIDHWIYDCCDGHLSFWNTITTSPQWKAWEKIAFKQGCDYWECTECNWISQRHFQAFLEFCKTYEVKDETK